jgi:hypothetical protein
MSQENVEIRARKSRCRGLWDAEFCVGTLPRAARYCAGMSQENVEIVRAVIDSWLGGDPEKGFHCVAPG